MIQQALVQHMNNSIYYLLSIYITSQFHTGRTLSRIAAGVCLLTYAIASVHVKSTKNKYSAAASMSRACASLDGQYISFKELGLLSANERCSSRECACLLAVEIFPPCHILLLASLYLHWGAMEDMIVKCLWENILIVYIQTCMYVFIVISCLLISCVNSTGLTSDIQGLTFWVLLGAGRKVCCTY